MGACWNGRKSGNFGLAGCFSTQTYKHLNAGEGGLLTSDDPAFMARATILSGSYMLYERHGAGPARETYADIRLDTPNMSARMDNLRAAILRPQLAPNRRTRSGAGTSDTTGSPLASPARGGIRLPRSPACAGSLCRLLDPIPDTGHRGGCGEGRFVADCAGRAASELKNGFGANEPVGFTSAHRSWRYVAAQSLPETDRILAGLFDMRLPLTFTLADCDLIADHIIDSAAGLRF